MKIVIAPDSFKGSLSAPEVARAIEKGIRQERTDVETVLLPVADGGEGTVDAVRAAFGGEIITVPVHDPLMREITASFLLAGDHAVIEMAAASGLPLLAEKERNVWNATSFGTGELIAEAIRLGAKKLLIGLGGSATNDGGTGLCKALGARFLDAAGEDAGFGARCARHTVQVDLSGLQKRLEGIQITIACDVKNPLCGANGASYIYAPQKGADRDELSELDCALSNLAEAVAAATGKDLRDKAGSGAAGGLGFALTALCGGKIRSGIDAVLELCKFQEKSLGADLIITGEGRADAQSVNGKVASGILSRAGETPVAIFAGGFGDGVEKLYDAGAALLMPIVDRPMTLDEAMRHTEELLTAAGRRLMRALAISRKMRER